MFQILIFLQALIMNWYITKIVFRITTEGNAAKSQFDEQLRLVTAESNTEAFLKARTIGLTEEAAFYNNNMKQIKWEFVNVSEVFPLNSLEDGVEVYSRIHETEEATSYINVVHKKAIAIRLSAGPIY
jgi:hypothetical protein